MRPRKVITTILHGQCLMQGQHPPGSDLAEECPLNPERARRRSEAAKQRWVSRRARDNQRGANRLTTAHNGTQEEALW